jgi:SNF2 family DNA or RNA helicase
MSLERSLTVVPHTAVSQVEGVRFIWKNSFSDFETNKLGNAESASGCLLAHNMGLGKSLTVLSVLHCVMNHPSMVDNTSNPLVRKVLLVVPVNTVANWENEFHKWTGKLTPSLVVYNIVASNPYHRPSMISRWQSQGGVLLVSDGTLKSICKDIKGGEEHLQADVLVIDEAHVSLFLFVCTRQFRF